mmetsp:Transcript_11179/g.36798  ORF Transcript_11179/g.36798 Transcript_11179/m.36798 type:complete len:244 (-) Transcript_11179:26-757(-)
MSKPWKPNTCSSSIDSGKDSCRNTSSQPITGPVARSPPVGAAASASSTAMAAALEGPFGPTTIALARLRTEASCVDAVEVRRRNWMLPRRGLGARFEGSAGGFGGSGCGAAGGARGSGSGSGSSRYAFWNLTPRLTRLSAESSVNRARSGAGRVSLDGPSASSDAGGRASRHNTSVSGSLAESRASFCTQRIRPQPSGSVGLFIHGGRAHSKGSEGSMLNVLRLRMVAIAPLHPSPLFPRASR